MSACDCRRDSVGSEETPYSSIANLSNIYEEWSWCVLYWGVVAPVCTVVCVCVCVCARSMDNTRAADASESSTESAFNKAFVKAIEKKHYLPVVHDQIMQGMYCLCSAVIMILAWCWCLLQPCWTAESPSAPCPELACRTAASLSRTPS